MPRALTSPVPVTARQARRVWLHYQRLDEREPFGSGPVATTRAIEHLGYVQIDTINVIERCHHHILFSRIPGYRRADLRQAQSLDKTVFEFWTHALSYVPTRDIGFYLRAMSNDWKQSRWLSSVKAADMNRLIKRIEQEGPLSIREIEEEKLTKKDHLWASLKPSKRVLERAFYQGLLAVSARTGMLKNYDLMGRHFGWEERPRAATESEIIAHMLDRSLTAQGIVSLDSICHLDAPRKAGMRRLIETRVKRKELIPVAVEDAGKQEHWATPEAIGKTTLPPPDLVHILSPFDPLIIQRKRLKLFFGYDHIFEAYVPKEKRVMGYFALPVLFGDEIVAAIDLKTDRANGKLLMQK